MLEPSLRPSLLAVTSVVHQLPRHFTMLSIYLLLPMFTNATPLTGLSKRQNSSSPSLPGGPCADVTNCVYNYGCTDFICDLIPTGDSCAAGTGPVDAVSLCASGFCDITCEADGVTCNLRNCIEDGSGIVGLNYLCLENAECQSGLFCQQYQGQIYGSCQTTLQVGQQCVNGVASQDSALSPNSSCASGICDWNTQTSSGSFVCLAVPGSVEVGGNCTNNADCPTGFCDMGICDSNPTTSTSFSQTFASTNSPTSSTSNAGSLSQSSSAGFTSLSSASSSFTPQSPASSTTLSLASFSARPSSSSATQPSFNLASTSPSSSNPTPQLTSPAGGTNNITEGVVVTVGTTEICDVERVCWSGICFNGICAPLDPPAGINGACSSNFDCSGYSNIPEASTVNCTDLTEVVGSGICEIVGSLTVPRNTSAATGDSCIVPGSVCFSGNCTSGICQPGATKVNLQSACSANADCAGYSIDSSISTSTCTGIGSAVGSGICTQIEVAKPRKSPLSTGAKAGIGFIAILLFACLVMLYLWARRHLAESKEKAHRHLQDNEALTELKKEPKSKLQTLSIVVLGLDGHGKTSFLHQAQQIFKMVPFDGDSVLPTLKTQTTRIGVESAVLEFHDLPGRINLRPQWLKTASTSHAICYIVDCTDFSRARESIVCLEKILRSSKVTGTPVLVALNKIDSPYAPPPDDVQPPFEHALNFRPVGSDWAVMPISAARGDGVEAAVTWLFSHAQISRKALGSRPLGAITHRISELFRL